jgi:hypothetical protein
MTITASNRLADPDGRAWLRAALKTVNAPLPVETTPEDMVDYVLGAHTDLHAAVRIAALIDEVPGPTLANLVTKRVFSYAELRDAMERIRPLGLDVTETRNGQWISEMAGFEVAQDTDRDDAAMHRLINARAAKPVSSRIVMTFDELAARNDD